MRRLADGLYLLRGLPPFVINDYLMGGVIVNAGTSHAARRIRSPRPCTCRNPDRIA